MQELNLCRKPTEVQRAKDDQVQGDAVAPFRVHTKLLIKFSGGFYQSLDKAAGTGECPPALSHRPLQGVGDTGMFSG